MEVLTKSCRSRKGSHSTFLQTDRNLFKHLDDDEDSPNHLSDSYSDTNSSSGDEHARPTTAASRKSSQNAKGDHTLKADHKMIRAVEKTMYNLLHAPNAPFTEQNRSQLASYLQQLEIGGDPERGEGSGISLADIVIQDRVASFYFNLLIDE